MARLTEVQTQQSDMLEIWATCKQMIKEIASTYSKILKFMYTELILLLVEHACFIKALMTLGMAETMKV